MLAESASIGTIRNKTKLPFKEWILIGAPDKKGILSHKQNLTKYNKRRGLYMHAFEYNGVFYIFYAGKSAGIIQALTHRIRCEYLISQQKDSKSGPYCVYEYLKILGIKPRFYVSVCVLDGDDDYIAGKERDLLQEFDFIANHTYNNCRRIEHIKKIVGSVSGPCAEALDSGPCAEALDSSVLSSLDDQYASLVKRIHFIQSTLKRYKNLGLRISAIEQTKSQLNKEVNGLIKKKALIDHQNAALKKLLDHIKNSFPTIV